MATTVIAVRKNVYAATRPREHGRTSAHFYYHAVFGRDSVPRQYRMALGVVGLVCFGAFDACILILDIGAHHKFRFWGMLITLTAQLLAALTLVAILIG